MKLIISDLAHLPDDFTKDSMVIENQGEIRPCIGCFGCWIKTPGVCVLKDGYEDTGAKLGHCDELVIISQCVYGSYSPFVKNVLDRAISYVHPDFDIRHGEMHHKRRYENTMIVSVYFYGKEISLEEQKTAKCLVQGNVVNYDGILKQVRFFPNPQELEGALL